MPDDPKPRFFVDPSWWLEATQKVGVPTAILVAIGIAIRAVYIDIIVPAYNRADKHVEVQDRVSEEREQQFYQQTKLLKGQHQLQKDQLELSRGIAKKLEVEYVVAKKIAIDPDAKDDDAAADEKPEE